MPKPKKRIFRKVLALVAATAIGLFAGKTLSTLEKAEQKTKPMQRTVEQKKKIILRNKVQKEENLTKLIDSLAKEHNTNNNFIKALAKIESNFNVNAVGKHNDKGLLQLTPIAIKQIAKLGFKITDPFDAKQNILGGILLAKYNEDIAKFKTLKTKRGFKKVKRKFLYKGKLLEFDLLPREIQLKILAEMHNKGPSFLKNSEKVEIEKKFTNYAKRFWEAFKEFERIK